MKKIFLSVAAIGLLSIGCSDTKTEAPAESSATEQTATGTENATSNTAASDTNTAEVKLNPPHGEPGHRCEIAVGAPLDGSAPAQLNTSVQPTNNGQGFLNSGNAAPAQPAANAQTTAPGMQGKPNPAHGQPGHRCDIQVGQPLP